LSDGVNGFNKEEHTPFSVPIIRKFLEIHYRHFGNSEMSNVIFITFINLSIISPVLRTAVLKKSITKAFRGIRL